ncbi:MAG: aldehyde dehydrogenase family protein [Candidatus Eremiobacteraeota bacterium]|nr:aldehyde dehydrogenase family protein [Candidatus Eremiobacteraeota bacterium]
MKSSEVIQVVSPADGSVVLERPAAGEREIRRAVQAARTAQPRWADLPLQERLDFLTRFTDALVAKKDEIAPELTRMMGRPISQSPGELRGFEERARKMIELAPGALEAIEIDDNRRVERLPHGVVFVVAAWNYPYLIAVNSVVPALAAGNVVILKHSSQTIRCAERFAEAFEEAGLPEGVFQVLHLTHQATEEIVSKGLCDVVSFTGSVDGGKALHKAAAGTFTPMGLELGGKDPAYVRADANLEFSAENLADGAFFNSGQSCCGIERIYVHESVFDEFVDLMIQQARNLKLGDPMDPQTTMGPLVRERAADYVRKQMKAAENKGAQALLKKGLGEGAYLPPEIFIDVHHGMKLMTEETFGPVVGIMSVASDEEAVLLMNDSRYGLTAAIFTRDAEAAARIGDGIETGTVFMNRCDYLDPALAWTGVKESGRGCTLSAVGYEHLTRPKSFHFRLPS